MDRARYTSLAALAGEWLNEPLPQAYPVDALTGVLASTAVYVINDALGRTVYVGSVCRPRQPRGFEARMREHLRSPAKRLVWHLAWVLPLRDDTPVSVVRLIEGTVGGDLRPRLNKRLPAI